jgi:hypothetical protein
LGRIERKKKEKNERKVIFCSLDFEWLDLIRLEQKNLFPFQFISQKRKCSKLFLRGS